MAPEEWSTHLDNQINAATIALITCDESEKDLVLENLRRDVRELTVTLLGRLWLQPDDGLNEVFPVAGFTQN
ncbi:MAG: hypothetical protein QOJ99_3418 [Bryobacterales bacterium]|jgi:hypothetical protein|nr:hypothetical protein [Bryobacterales bacterium]